METKGPFPAPPEGAAALPPAIRAFYQILQLKQLYRQGWLQHGLEAARCESVADHTFGVAVLALLLADEAFSGLDKARVLSMALLHELGEIYAGDLTPQDGISRAEKQERERRGVERALEGLPVGPAYLALWEEYAKGASAEAQFVRQVDRLEMALQASAYAASGAIDPTDFYRSAGRALTLDVLKQALPSLDAAK